MATKRARYQQGNIRKVERARGFAWEVRFSDTVNGKRSQKSLYFEGDTHPTQASVRKAIQLQVALANTENERSKIGVKFGIITSLYRTKHIPTLRKSTREKNAYLLRDFVEPKWAGEPLLSVNPLQVSEWISGLHGSKSGLKSKVRKPLAATTKSGIRSVMHQCFELAALHGYFPTTDRNPMSLVKVKGTSKRERETIILTQGQFKDLVTALPVPVNVMVLLIGCFGLRISELLGLHWDDIDVNKLTVFIQRSFTHGVIEDAKTKSSNAKLPVDEVLLGIIEAYKATVTDSQLVFPSPRTGGYRSASMLLQKGLQPVAIQLGLGRVRFHDLRHSCRTWLDGKGVSVGTQKDLLRHADIATTMNVYGRSLPPEMRVGHSAMVQGLIPDSMK